MSKEGGMQSVIVHFTSMHKAPGSIPSIAENTEANKMKMWTGHREKKNLCRPISSSPNMPGMFFLQIPDHQNSGLSSTSPITSFCCSFPVDQIFRTEPTSSSVHWTLISKP